MDKTAPGGKYKVRYYRLGEVSKWWEEVYYMDSPVDVQRLRESILGERERYIVYLERERDKYISYAKERKDGEMIGGIPAKEWYERIVRRYEAYIARASTPAWGFTVEPAEQ